MNRNSLMGAAICLVVIGLIGGSAKDLSGKMKNGGGGSSWEDCHKLTNVLVVEVGDSEKSKGATTISWNSSFVHLGHVCGDPIILDEAALGIAVDPAGAAEFVGFLDNKRHPFTPVSRRDPADGEIYIAEPHYDTVTVTFTGLHYDEVCEVFIGNSHFKVLMLVDKDGDRTLESQAQLGVNIHVEATADCP